MGSDIGRASPVETQEEEDAYVRPLTRLKALVFAAISGNGSSPMGVDLRVSQRCWGTLRGILRVRLLVREGEAVAPRGIHYMCGGGLAKACAKLGKEQLIPLQACGCEKRVPVETSLR